MAAARFDCKRAMVAIEWANSHPGCMNRPSLSLLSPFGVFISGREGGLGSERVFAS